VAHKPAAGGAALESHSVWVRACASIAIVLTCAFYCAAPLTSAVPLQSTLVDLQRAVDTIVSAPTLERASWGVLIESLNTGETIYALNSGKLMMPASTLKVITLAATAERLGWDYSYETRIVADGAVAGGTLQGNLVIVAGGDPSLSRRTLDSWAAQLKRLGVRTINGTVLADARRFGGQGLGAGWSWDDLAYYYAAPVAAAQFRENAVEITIRPGVSPGSPPSYELTPAGISGLRVENRMTTGSTTAAAEFAAHRAPNSPVVVIEGVVPARSRPVSYQLSVHDPGHFLAAAFAEALFDGGISIGAAPPADANADSTRDYSRIAPLLTHHSEPLRELARRFMDVSQNQYAETFIKTLGAQAGTPTFEGGVKAVESVLTSWNIPLEGAVLRDGSGLSRYNYTAPSTLVRVLAHVYRDPAHREPFFSSLTVAGRTGTIAGRMKNTAAAGNARAKDGAMAGVRALCGVVNTADGEPLIFAILANGFATPGPIVNAAIDAIVVQLAGFRR
jgi:D-alanyl-D-alanine carboxypeptidase/D-alanyl-D-alanine-endopeptidase (penicillin-binding protein 4)